MQLRHCEPTGRANARPMTGSAKQSIAVCHAFNEREEDRSQPIGIIEVPKLHDQIGSTRTSSQLRFHLRIVAAERTGR
jgi:hypothetical protein